jgi:hypothetical protein
MLTSDQRAWQLRFAELRYRVFSGAPVVEVAPAQWGFDPTAVRQAANSRRYRETPPDQAGFLRFEFAPGFFPRHFDRGPGTDADRRRLAKLLAGQDQFWASTRRLRLGRADVGAVATAAGMTVVAEAADPAPPPAAEPVVEAPGREQWLRNHLDGRDELWVSVRHAKLPPPRIAEIAGSEGLFPAAEFADATDRILLLRRTPPPRPATVRKFRMSFAGFLAPAAWVLLCFGGSGVTTALTGDERVFAMGFGLTVLGVPPLLWVLRAFPRSTRVGWLAGEFTGKNGVTFFSGPFDVSAELVRQIAEFHGYFFVSQTATRAQGTLVTYGRR